MKIQYSINDLNAISIEFIDSIQTIEKLEDQIDYITKRLKEIFIEGRD